MFSGSEHLAIAVESAKRRALIPLARECAETLDLDSRQLEEIENYLHEAWFFGVRTGHAVMVETKMGQTDPKPVILDMQVEFQDMMERLGEALNTTVGATIQAWDYLGQAWIAGARFWEVEIAAQLIEARSGEIDTALRRLIERDSR